MDFIHQRKELLDAILEMKSYGLIYMKSGNLSVRVEDEKVLIKPSGRDYDEMKPEDLALVDLSGNLIKGDYKPSSETPMHTEIYKHVPWVNAIVHIHSTYSLVCAATHQTIPFFCNEFLDIGPELLCAEYAVPGSFDLGLNAVIEILEHDTVRGILLKNHGALAVGKTIEEACNTARSIEIVCQIYVLSQSLGSIKPMDDYQVRAINQRYKK